MSAWRDLRPGDRVTFLIPAGKRLDRTNGIVQEYAEKSGRVVMLCRGKGAGYLTGELSHLVVNGGGRHGTPYVVDDGNFLYKGGKKKAKL